VAARVTKLVLQVERRRHSTANRGQMVRDSTMVTVGSLLETTIALSDGIIADPMCPSLSKKCAKMHPEPTSRRVLPPGEYDRRYRQDSSVL